MSMIKKTKLLTLDGNRILVSWPLYWPSYVQHLNSKTHAHLSSLCSLRPIKLPVKAVPGRCISQDEVSKCGRLMKPRISPSLQINAFRLYSFYRGLCRVFPTITQSKPWNNPSVREWNWREFLWCGNEAAMPARSWTASYTRYFHINKRFPERRGLLTLPWGFPVENIW
jgi:hypothetical protein